MLHYAYSFVDGSNSFQHFWEYRYNVSDPQIILNNLVQEGYIAVGDIRYQLQRLSAAVIKKYLSDNGLKKTGNKADLIDRLVSSIDTTDIFNSLPHYYCLTEKGTAATRDPEFDYILYVHRNQFLDDYGINIVTIRSYMSDKPPALYKQFIADYLLRQSNPPFYNIAEIFADVEDYENAFMYHIIDLRRFLCGQTLQFHDPMTAPVISSFQVKYIFPYETSLLRIPSGRLRSLRDVLNILKYDNALLYQRIKQIVEQFAASQFFFTDSDCIQIIYSELQEDVDTLTAIYNNAEQRFIAKYGL